MATTKNITMKQFNGTDYDTLYPKTIAAQIDDVYSKSETYPQSQLYTRSQLYTKDQTLTNATKSLYGLSSNAVPDDVLQAIRTILDERAIVESGTYTGTGTRPVSIVFSIVPKYVIIQARDNSIGGDIYTGWWISGMTYLVDYNSTSTTRPVTLNDKTFSWTGTALYTEEQLLNESGTVYSYIAIGGVD